MAEVYKAYQPDLDCYVVIKVLHMQTAGLVEVRNWVLQFGSGAEVLAPQSLRQDCMAEIEKMSRVYEA